ncbi:MAG: hypothetical protein V3V62_14665 [bacterium]
MANEKRFRPMYNYLEFGVRLHLDDFTQLTVVALIVFLPVAAVALVFHPSLLSLIKPSGDLTGIISRVVVSQVLMRVLQTFVFILLILKVDAQLKEEGSVWDFTEALSRLKRVALVDLAYVFGLQALAIIVLWVGMVAAGFLFGESPVSFPIAVIAAGFVVVGPAVRYYFCTFASLIHGTPFFESFRLAGAVSNGAERLIVLIVLTYMSVWFVTLQIFQGIFGRGLFGQVMIQAGVMVASISYFFATFRLYLDLSLAESNRIAGEGGEGGEGDLRLPPRAEADSGEEEPPGAG